MYDFKSIEKKWQEIWENDDYFKAIDFHPTKEKYYILYEFYHYVTIQDRMMVPVRKCNWDNIISCKALLRKMQK